MIYILTSTNTLLKTEVRPQESNVDDSVAEGLLHLKLKQQLTSQAFNEQQGYLSVAAIAAYVSLNKLDQRQRYRASLNLLPVESESFNFTQGSSSSGLGYALSLFESWWKVVLKHSGEFKYPLFVTGEILTSGQVKGISHLEDKIESACKYVKENEDTISNFYLCYPEENDAEITKEQREQVKRQGGILLPVSRLQSLLGELLGDMYDGDPLGRWAPFKGLNSFNYEDSVRFFGRDKDIERLYDDLNQNDGLLIVTGASGTGKSSLIKAGLIPLLEQKNEAFYWSHTTPSMEISKEGVIGFIFEQLDIAWGLRDRGGDVQELISTFRHSIDDGIEKLLSLMPERTRKCLLYLDQYEEVFNQSDQSIDDITFELTLIDELARQLKPLMIVLALRNEYLGRLLDNQALSSPIITNIPSQLSPDAWHDIIHEQAAFSGISFERDKQGTKLDSVILSDAVKTPYALPMVEFLLEQLHSLAVKDEPSASLLKFKHYIELGGLSGAIAYRAQHVLDSSEIDKDLLPQFFDMFVGLNGESLPYAKKVDVFVAKESAPAIYVLIQLFKDANLIVSASDFENKEVVKLAHDCLFDQWDGLKAWLSKYNDYLLWRYSIDGTYNRWKKNDSKNRYLLSDSSLLKEGKIFLANNVITDGDLLRFIQSSSRNKARKYIVLFIVFILLPVASFGLYQWDHNRIKIYTYEEIAKKWEVPLGINEIDSLQIAKRNYHYSLEYQGGILKEVKKLNSVGNLYGNNLEDGVALWEYRYSGTGKVNEVISKTRSGKMAAVNYYQFSDDNTALLTFSNNIDKVGFSIVSPKDKFGLRLQQGKSKISRKLLKFNENGLLKQINYQDPYGRNTTDYQGYYGSSYEYSYEGLITKTSELNKRLEPIITSQISFKYDSNNRKTLELESESFNLSEIRFMRDYWGNVIEKSLFYNFAPTTRNGMHKLKYSYDQQGFLIEEQNLGINDELVAEQGSPHSKVKYKYDGNGNLEEASFFGKNDQLTYHRIYGYALGKYKFNDKNQLKETSSFGVLKEPILMVTAKVSNVFKNKVEYDSRGNRIRESYFGLNGEPVLSGDFYHRYDSKYNKYNQLVEQRIYGADNKPTLGDVGLFMKKFEYDPQGNLIKASSFGINEEPIINMQGFHAATNKYDEIGNVIEEAAYNSQGNLILSADGMAVSRMKYDDFGNLTEMSYFDQFNNPVLNKEGISRVVVNRGARHISGFEYYGTRGEPVLNDEGVHRSVQHFDSEGRMTYGATYGINNELVIEAGDNFTSTDITYHPNGKQKRFRGYYKDGSYSQLIQDIRGNALSFSFHDKNHNPILGSGDFSDFSNSITKYDEYGNPTERTFLDEKGDPGVNKPGYSKVIYLKDKNGVLTHKWAAYDIKGNLLRGFNTKLIKIKDKEEDKEIWEYLKSLNTKDAIQMYLDLTEQGYHREEAVTELNKFTSRIQIKNSTEGGKILLNGKYIGNTPEVITYLKPGDYEVSVKNEGYRTYKENIVVKDSDKINLSIKLEKDSSSWDKKTLTLKANEGSAEAQKNLGNKYLDEGEFAQAMSWYQKAAAQGYSPAMNNIGYLYETAKGVNKDLQESYKWYLKAAKNGFGISQRRLGVAFYLGDLVEKDSERSLDFFIKVADQGNAFSQDWLGRHYFQTRAQASRPSIESIKAFNYFKLASHQGFKKSYRLLGLMSEGGLIMDFDLEKVTYWYKKAFEEDGDVDAAYLLADIYVNGMGTEIDFEKAIYWYKKAALKGDVTAASDLAELYLDGTNFFKDREKGMFWLQKAAELNDPYSIKKLKDMQLYGTSCSSTRCE